MKLIIAGANGFVASEVIRQSLRSREITSVVALSRQPVVLEAGAQSAKLKTVIVEDYETYSDDVKKELAGANACIWTIAITPSKSKSFAFSEVKRICQDSTIAGFKAIHASGTSRPFRFIYMSGIGAERDQTKTPDWMPEYSLMRGETETQVLAYAAQHAEEVEVQIIKSGFITAPGYILKNVFASILKWTKGVGNVCIAEISAAMIDQALHGFQQEMLLNDDLVKVGQDALKLQEGVE
ncbi:hypothetical protein G7046_g565 [Stylonectria norvegica]|nr:hypothetical protein G7046_g565 [Stylonectria norvegica]